MGDLVGVMKLEREWGELHPENRLDAAVFIINLSI